MKQCSRAADEKATETQALRVELAAEALPGGAKVAIVDGVLMIGQGVAEVKVQ